MNPACPDLCIHNDGSPYEQAQTRAACDRVTAQFIESYERAHGEILRKQCANGKETP